MSHANGIFSRRAFYYYIAIVCALLLGAGYYFEYVMDLLPCPLCVLQRLSFLLVGLTALIAAIHHPAGWGRFIYGGLTTFFAFSGVISAGRQIWLQGLPPGQAPACGPGFDYLVSTFPLQEAIELIFMRSGECAEVQWELFGLSMPGWAFLFFVGFCLLGLFQLRK